MKQRFFVALLLLGLGAGLLLLRTGVGAPTATPATLLNTARLAGIAPADAEDKITGFSRGWKGPLRPSDWGINVSASLGNPASQNETTIAIDLENSLNVLASANEYRNGLKPWIYASSDGGTTWTNYPISGTVSTLLYGDPSLAFGKGGFAYFGYLGGRSTGSRCDATGGMYISRSSDSGAHFSSPVNRPTG